MIRKQDILDRAREWELRPEVVEKDYILGWLLVALASHAETSTRWVFKGGTCLKKCYFETYRFSEDLDFSLLPEARYTEEELRKTVREVCRQASEMSGITFPDGEVRIEPLRDRMGRETFKGRVYYRGPLGRPQYARVLLDLTRHEPVADGTVARAIYHPYPDADAQPGDARIRAYSIHELLAEKTRALFERTRPRDLYDVVYILDNQPEVIDFDRSREVFQAKCRAKGFAAPTAEDLLRTIREAEELRSEWENMLAHQLPQLPKLDPMLGRAANLLGWVEVAAPLPSMGLRPVPAMGPAGQEIVAPAGIRFWGSGSALERIRFAGANRLMIEFSYDGKHRIGEPYSLRRASTGNLLLYVWESGAAHIRAFKVAELGIVRVTDSGFAPRYRIEFAASGPMPIGPRRGGRPTSRP